MTNLINHPLFSTFTIDPIFAWGAVATVIGGGAFLLSRSVEAMLVTVTAFAFAILPAMHLL